MEYSKPAVAEIVRASTITLIVCIGVLVAIICLIHKASTRQFRQAQSKPVNVSHTQIERSTVMLNSNAPNHMIVVPLVSEDNQIMVSGQFADQKINCLIDTGCRDIILWDGRKVQGAFVSSTFDYPWFSANIMATTTCLSSARVGGFVLSNACCAQLHTVEPRLTWSNTGQPIYAIMGNYAFQHVVLTIDYTHQTLTVRDLTYDVTKLSLTARDTLSDITYDPYYYTHKECGPLRVFLDVHIEGQAVRAIVDTGYDGGILLSSEFRKRLTHLPADQRLQPPYIAMGPAAVTAQTASPLHWSLGKLKGQAPGHVLTGRFSPDHQALIGYEMLKDYRITIDYQRQKMLFEYLGSSASKTKTLYTQTPPKPHTGKHPTLRWVQKPGGRWEEVPVTSKD